MPILISSFCKTRLLQENILKRLFLFAVIFSLFAFAFAKEEFGIYNSGGVAWASVTRIQKQSTVSNFVWNDKMVGVFYECQSYNLKNFSEWFQLNFMGRMALYYPYRYYFRNIRQFPAQMLVISLDFFTAPCITFSLKDFVRFDLEPGLHLKYQKQDKWKYWNLGPGIKLDAEFPLSPRWTIVLGGMFSWDNGNLGSNRGFRDFDYVWEYQCNFGVRYSKHQQNKKSYLKGFKKYMEEQAELTSEWIEKIRAQSDSAENDSEENPAQ